MSPAKSYGVVYTPDALSEFVADILYEEWVFGLKDTPRSFHVLDPACGEASLLKALEAKALKDGLSGNFTGVDVDETAIIQAARESKNPSMEFYAFDAILPEDRAGSTMDYWKEKFPVIDMIIANPPWSSEKIYDNKKLNEAGFKLNVGQFDSYILFVELCLNLLTDQGICAFILPDSIFSGENKELRKYLAQKTQIKIIARLGEKLFPDVNRAVSILVIKKAAPSSDTVTKCFRLATEQRKAFLSGKSSLLAFYHKEMHKVKQSRFTRNVNFSFDVDTRQTEEELLYKIKRERIIWSNIFHFGRGVEISKKGELVFCPQCGMAQTFTGKQKESGKKKCKWCAEDIELTDLDVHKIIRSTPVEGYQKIYVGENVQRYGLRGEKYIKLNVEGINYKEPELYTSPKILIRKTGLGINACIDDSGAYISQTVYTCFYKQYLDLPLEYYLGILNSRVMFYYYLKIYGENEWKSHPYITKDILFSLPVKSPDSAKEALCRQIAELARQLNMSYIRDKDLELEAMIMELYKISREEERQIKESLNNMPDLGAINHMKF
ncbi:N-6 DNA methylase [Hungatella effluvii]|uniref:N-6 DNA methylase n=1 Tax=Hungatella effluvii TaxID=1096246 RepID=UPI0022E32A11|nr:N-6 DNA methylase [Hungatella effluvii]